MTAVNLLIPVLVTFMLITGVCNTLLTKYQVCLSITLLLAAADGNLGQHLRP